MTHVIWGIYSVYSLRTNLFESELIKFHKILEAERWFEIHQTLTLTY